MVVSRYRVIDGIPVWWFHGIFTSVDEELIDAHMKGCEFLTQVHLGGPLAKVKNIIKSVKATNTKPTIVFVHVYPFDSQDGDRVVSLYCNGLVPHGDKPEERAEDNRTQV